MSLWRDKINRTILISSIALLLLLIVIVVIVVNPVVSRDPEVDPNDIPGLNWLRIPWAWVLLLGFLMWGIFFNLVLLIGSIREKMNALPGWTELTISALLTLLPAIFIGTLANFSQDPEVYPYVETQLTLLKWMVFMVALVGVILITLWILMSKTPREEQPIST
ncbi:MAG: hypothetical protein FK731_11440 [Asgard group archaeon]|nr:hypothetical protein [Asgard group archaeon]